MINKGKENKKSKREDWIKGSCYCVRKERTQERNLRGQSVRLKLY